MILIIYAHPYPQHSHANKRMLEQARTLEGVEVRSLYQLYPDFNIDIAAEQDALSRASRAHSERLAMVAEQSRNVVVTTDAALADSVAIEVARCGDTSHTGPIDGKLPRLAIARTGQSGPDVYATGGIRRHVGLATHRHIADAGRFNQRRTLAQKT